LYDIKSDSGVEVQIHSFLTLALEGGRWTASWHHNFKGKGYRYRLYRWLSELDWREIFHCRESNRDCTFVQYVCHSLRSLRYCCYWQLLTSCF